MLFEIHFVSGPIIYMMHLAGQFNALSSSSSSSLSRVVVGPVLPLLSELSGEEEGPYN